MKRIASAKFVRVVLFTACVTTWCTAAAAAELPIVDHVERQPLEAQARRVVQALKLVGTPLGAEQQRQLEAAFDNEGAAQATAEIQKVFDSLCLAAVRVDRQGNVHAAAGPAPPRLVQNGWRTFLVKVHNEAGTTAALCCLSPSARTLAKLSINVHRPPQRLTPQDVSDRFMEIDLVNRPPLGEHLSGLELEYCVVQFYSRDAGRRDATLLFDLGKGTFDTGRGNDVKLHFDCAAAVEVKLDILDDDGRPTLAQLTFRDAAGHVYPGLSRRLAPDFYFHDQIYRSSGQSVKLPAGKYRVTYTRGPEYKLLERDITVPPGPEHHESFRLARWINMAEHGWFSGDHHIHAAGCAHYDSPTEGVTPDDMMRQILGEDLNVGCVLSWGPCWYHQKQFFEGKVHKLSTDRHLMRYDVETSGFPSSHAGHLCLLRLHEDDFPRTKVISQWPSWNLPILKWAKAQGGIVGYAHSGFGLETSAHTLTNYEMPKFNGIGANEYIVDVTHGACDFISAVDTPSLWELNIWYHTLNCGYTTRISGETDYPCISDKRVGMGRAYVQMDKSRPLDYDRWIEGVRDGRSYCTEGSSHLFDFTVGGLGVGCKGAGGRPSVLAARSGQLLEIRVRAAALLPETPNETIRRSPLDQQPYWHLERARINGKRIVTVEVVINGDVSSRRILADGSVQDVSFIIKATKSGWIAMRIFPSSHTNPIFVEVDGRPVRLSRKSAQWCRQAVDVCWKSKLPLIRAEERPAAAAAFDHARKEYERIAAESPAD